MFRFFSSSHTHAHSHSTAEIQSTQPSETEFLLPVNQDRPARCSPTHFWITSEFIYNFCKVSFLSTFALGTFLTDIAQIESDYETTNLSNLAVYMSIPLGILLGISEGLCHYAESKLITDSDYAARTDVERGESPASPSLSKLQYLLVGMHLFSDTFSDVGGLLAIAEVYGLKDQAIAARASTYVALILFSSWGNFQEARNASESFRDLNERRSLMPA